MEASFSEEWRAHGDHIARDAGQWEFHARLLLQGARVCRERHEVAAEAAKEGIPSGDLTLSWVATFLAALAVEGLLKAIAIKQDPALIERKEFYTHDLQKIATSFAGISLAGEESLLLGKLRGLIEWAGRYPVPQWHKEEGRTKYDVRESRNDAGVPVIDLGGMPWTASWSEVTAFIQRLHEKYHESKSQE